VSWVHFEAHETILEVFQTKSIFPILLKMATHIPIYKVAIGIENAFVVEIDSCKNVLLNHAVGIHTVISKTGI
jgi:hypothetical protein